MKYTTRNPFLSDVAKVCRHFGMTEFSNRAEFWTLGHYWEEFRQLSDLGIKFRDGGYHNVDRDWLPDAPSGCVAHPNTEFLHIHELWHKPACINFDSTNVIIESNTKIMNSLTRLTVRALEKSDKVLLNINLMIGYAHTYAWEGDPDQVLYDWVDSLRCEHEIRGNQIDFYNSSKTQLRAKVTKRSNTRTPMLHFHALVSKCYNCL